MLKQGGLDLGRGQTVSRDVDHVVHPTTDPVVSILVATRSVTGEVEALVDVQVGIHVPLVGAPDGAGHAGPRLLEGQHPLDVVAVDLVPRDGVNNRGVHPEERQGCTSGLGGRDPPQGRDDMGARFGLPVGVANVSFLLAHLFEIPLPDFRGDGFPHGPQDAQMSHLVVNVVVAGALEQTQGRGSHVELGDLVLVDHIPVPREVGVGRGTLEDDGGTTQEQGRVDDIGVPGDPADVPPAEEAVVVVDVEHVLAGRGGAEQVAGRGVHDALGLAGRSGGVEQEQRVFGADGFGRDVVGVLLDLLVPPQVPTRGPGDLGTGAFEDQDAGDVRALLEGLVDDALGANDLAPPTALVRGDDDLGAGVQHPVPQRVGGEPREDDRVHGTDTRAGQEGDQSLGDHGQIDGHRVPLLDPLLLEGPGHPRDLPQQLPIGNRPALIGLVGLVDDGHLVGVLDGVPVDTVERRVQPALDEPGHIPIDERAGAGGLEIPVKREQVTGHAGPERIRTPDRLLIELLVFLEAFQMGPRRVFLVERFGDIEGVDFVRLRDL